MSLEILGTMHEWVLRASIAILCWLAYCLHRQMGQVASFFVLAGLVMAVASILLSNLSWQFLLKKTVTPESWEMMVIISNVLGIIGYVISVLGCIFLFFQKNKRLAKDYPNVE